MFLLRLSVAELHLVVIVYSSNRFQGAPVPELDFCHLMDEVHPIGTASINWMLLLVHKILFRSTISSAGENSLAEKKNQCFQAT